MLHLPETDLKKTRFYQEVFSEGREEGREEGRDEGRKEGEAAVLLLLIEHKFGPPSDAVRTRVENADAETLLHWSTRVLTAQRVEELWET